MLYYDWYERKSELETETGHEAVVVCAAHVPCLMTAVVVLESPLQVRSDVVETVGCGVYAVAVVVERCDAIVVVGCGIVFHIPYTCVRTYGVDL